MHYFLQDIKSNQSDSGGQRGITKEMSTITQECGSIIFTRKTRLGRGRMGRRRGQATRPRTGLPAMTKLGIW